MIGRSRPADVFCNPHNLTGYKLPAKTYAKNNKVLVSQKSKKAIVKWQMTREMQVNKTNLISFTNKFCKRGRETASYLFGSLALARVGLFHFLRELAPIDCKLQFKEKYYALCD